jgi:hypothetical protein
MRGNEARIHTNTVAINIVPVIRINEVSVLIFPMKKVTVNSLIIIILAYSAIKINANVALLYSVLNPETSSDSPSARSNGVRFVSARLVINHKSAIGLNRTTIHEYIFMFIRFMFMECCRTRQVIKISDIDTSYEIVWAILRRDPSRAYLEFENQPAINVEYTFKLDTHRKYSTPKFIIIDGKWWG